MPKKYIRSLFQLLCLVLLTNLCYGQKKNHLNTTLTVSGSILNTNFRNDGGYLMNRLAFNEQLLVQVSHGFGKGFYVNLGVGTRSHSDYFNYYTGFNYQRTATLITIKHSDVLLTFKYATPGSIKKFVECGFMFSKLKSGVEIETDDPLNDPAAFARNIGKEINDSKNILPILRMGVIISSVESGLCFTAGVTAFTVETRFLLTEARKAQ